MVVLGGTFDPIHYGHLHGARHVSKSLDGAKVTLMVAPEPQLRNPPEASFEDRWEMLSLACEPDSKLLPSQFENRHRRPTRTIHTLQKLAQSTKSAVVWVLGSDAFESLPQWYQAEDLPNFTSLFVLARPNTEICQVPRGFTQVRSASELLDQTGHVFVATTAMLDIAATDIRRRVRMGLEVSHLLPSSVLEHIMKKGLYQN